MATGEAFDDEMAARISAHRARRGGDWRVVEEPLDLAAAIDAAAGPDSAVLVDCLTVWLGNLAVRGRDADAAASVLADVLGRAAGPVVLVAGETGLGIVPRDRDTRAFRDRHGRLNQALAEICDRVILVVAGLPLAIKDAGA